MKERKRTVGLENEQCSPKKKEINLVGKVVA